MSENESKETPEIEVDPVGGKPPTLRANSSLGEAIEEYEKQMVRKGYSANTIQAFRTDLKILRSFMDGSAVLREIQTQHLEDFLEWMRGERGRPCSAKTLARRITTLKVFFSWLHGSGVIGTDPADPVVHHRVRTPLPAILSNQEVTKLMRVCQDRLWDLDRSDSRPYLLVSLLMQTGIKKSEAVKILVDDIDRSDPHQPAVRIRYEEERYAHKDRTLDLNPYFLGPLDQYIAQYSPDHFLFACTPRNLEYVLQEAGELALIRRMQVGFETLRWTSAVRDFKQGMKEERLRLKMGLSKVSWRDTITKLQRLAGGE